MTEREKFEKWFKDYLSGDGFEDEIDKSIAKDPLGDYKITSTLIAFDAYQAATKAALPEWIPVSERMPEVLGKVTTYDGKSYSFVGESCHDNQWSLKDDATGKVYHTPIGDIFPIETPAEKAARLKSEWCTKAAKQLKNLECTSTLTSIYDALLSGELQAPKGE